MTEAELRKLFQKKMKESNMQNYAKHMANIVCDVYMKGFNDGLEVGTKLVKS